MNKIAFAVSILMFPAMAMAGGLDQRTLDYFASRGIDPGKVVAAWNSQVVARESVTHTESSKPASAYPMGKINNSPANKPRKTRDMSDVPYKAYFEEAASVYGHEVETLVAMCDYESGFDQDARGKAGEIGLMQIMPGTARDLRINPYDARENILGGAKYLRQIKDKQAAQGYLSEREKKFWSLAAYNCGPNGCIPEVSEVYAENVLLIERQYSSDM